MEPINNSTNTSTTAWARLRAIVEAALLLPPESRRSFLNEAVPDEALRAEAEQLLAFDSDASAMFAVTGWQRASTEAIREEVAPGSIVGNYRILEELGSGGMGVVYLAERADGAYHQRVALKILRDSIFSAEMERRFRTERQILARLDHPGIARLVDGGVTAGGRPYFVLEFVEGEPVDHFCDHHHLDTAARLQLFLRIAEAVQSAHQQLVLHLDLKPANILVTADAQPRLLDFGIALMLQENEQETQPSAMLMTPRYASPEQAAGRPLGVASDVFSLGTLLYRMLTGVLPYPIEGATPLEAARAIAETEPLLPSRAASPNIAPLLRGDLDTILLHALRKEPERRYPTVAAFAEDIQRHMQLRPVAAHRDSLSYRVQKFLRRNRLPVFATAAAACTIAGSMVMVVRSERRATAAQAAAERRLKDVRGIAHSYIFDINGKLENVPGTLAVRELVLRNAKVYLEAMSREGTADDSLLTELSEGYAQVGRVQANPGWPSLRDWNAAAQSQRKAIALDRDLLARHPDDAVMRLRLLGHLLGLSQTHELDGDLSEREAANMQALEVAAPALDQKPESLRYLAVAVAPLMLARLHIGDDDWTDADIQSGMPWLEKTDIALQRYGAAMPAGNPDPVFTSAQRVLHHFRAVAWKQTGERAKARQEFEAALRDPSPSWNGQSEEPVQRAIKLHYAYFLLDEGELDRAIAIAPRSATSRVHERAGDTLATMEDANDTVQQSIFALRKGRIREGREGMKGGVAALEALLAKSPGDALQSANLSYTTLRLAGETHLSVEERRSLFLRARQLAEEALHREPEAMQAALVVARCDLGMAELEHSREHISHAKLMLQRVLDRRGTQVEAASLLQSARRMEQD